MGNDPMQQRVEEAKAKQAIKETPEQELIRLRAENARLMAQSQTKGGVTCKVGSKGGVSAYGLGRFPVTLYKSQWLKLLAAADFIREFIQANDHALTVKEAQSKE